MKIAYLNGKYLPLNEAKISVLDRGFLFGDGIYEFIPCYEDTLFLLTEHLERLKLSLKAIQLANPLSDEEWRTLLRELVKRNGGGDQKVYLQVTRGAASVRNHSFSNPAPSEPTVVAFTSPLSSPDANLLSQGGAIITLPDSRWLNCYIKSINLLPNILAHEAASSQSCQEAVFIREGLVTEGASSNIFIVKEGKIMTPPLTETILGGVTRELVLKLAKKHGIPAEEKPISSTALQEATEVWITSSTREILPILRINDRVINNSQVGKIWQKMILHYRDFKQQYITQYKENYS